MQSHTYQFNLRDLIRLLGPGLVVTGALALGIHAGRWLDLWPAPRPTLDVDRTILIHQIEAASQPQDAQIVLLGDSSCLMDVDAAALTERLGRAVLNLGTLSYLDLSAQAALLQRFTQANPGRLRRVVLLLHPEALRRPTPEPYYTKLFRSLLEQRESPAPTVHGRRLARWLGLETLRERVVARLVPTPLPGAYGRRYGFSRELEAYLQAHRGSAIDPTTRPFEGSAEYRLAPTWQAACRRFRSSLPSGVRVAVGITPVPTGFALRDYRDTRARMLRQLAAWLDAEALESLPPVLPDAWFASVTHLNARGVPHYTTALAAALSPQSRPSVHRHWPPRARAGRSPTPDVDAAAHPAATATRGHDR